VSDEAAARPLLSPRGEGGHHAHFRATEASVISARPSECVSDRTLSGASETWDTKDRSSVLIAERSRTIIEEGALIFVWIIGIWVTVKMMVEFSSVLKPLVLAALLVAILETMVQFIEHICWKSGIVVGLCARKLFLILRILTRKCLAKCCRMAQHIFGKECYADRAKPIQKDFKELKDWKQDRKQVQLPWHGSLAGQNFLYRSLAVVTTLMIVTGVVFFLQSIMASNLSTMLNNLDAYKNQLLKILNFCKDNLAMLPDQLSFLPVGQRHTMSTQLKQWQQHFDPESLVSSVEGVVEKSLNSWVVSTQSFLYELLFFILYCFLWLFSPVHINPHSDLTEDYGKSKVRKRMETIVPMRSASTSSGKKLRYGMTRSLSEVMEQIHKHIDECPSTKELQEHLYTIMWEYFRLKISVNTIFALCSYGLLYWCHLDLAGLVAVSSFFLSFIPELGTIICIILPVPLILLAPPHSIADVTTTYAPDGNPFPDWDYRVANLFKALLGMMLLKLLISNILEPWIMGRSPVLSGSIRKGEASEETHPVIVLFAVVVFGQIWDTTGMLISVPVISVIRLGFNVWSHGVE